MKKQAIISDHEVTKEGSLASYSVGFLASVSLTILAYILVVNHSLPTNSIVAIIAFLAIIQFVVQAFYFLHLDSEKRQKWKITAFLFMLLVVVILVFGSIWIMQDLNYRMTPQEMETYLKDQGGL